MCRSTNTQEPRISVSKTVHEVLLGQRSPNTNRRYQGTWGAKFIAHDLSLQNRASPCSRHRLVCRENRRCSA